MQGFMCFVANIAGDNTIIDDKTRICKSKQRAACSLWESVFVHPPTIW